MKITKLVLLLTATFLLGVLISSCGGKSHSHEASEMTGKEYTSAYICPMHCEGSGSDQPGTCPVCGMDYEKNENHKADGHKHESSDSDGHDHDDHDGHDHQ
jgi:hypothetical protein